ncbi:MAG TPA: hypothetical protein VE620_05710 [Myxococcales bacterium]|jgi:hypothetical protein|nr:hypothetical protein [Myxococcales bacterium]
MIRRFLLVALALCALPLPGRGGQVDGRAPDAGPQNAPLSAEDADVVKQLTLLEDVELVRNLDLFEEKTRDRAQAPDAGMPDAGTPAPHQ